MAYVLRKLVTNVIQYDSLDAEVSHACVTELIQYVAIGRNNLLQNDTL